MPERATRAALPEGGRGPLLCGAMGASARLSTAAIRVECGSEATCQVTVRNTGTVVDEYAFAVLGESAAWTAVDPPTLSLFPDAEGEVTVTFRPPRDASTPVGQLPFGVRVASKEDPRGSVVEEGTVDVSPFVDISAEIVPHTSRGRQSGSHEVAIDNRGNQAVEVALSGTDPNDDLTFRFSAPSVTAAPGTASFSRFRVSSRGLLWRGQPATLPFAVTVTPYGQQPIRLDASFQQQPMIPAWLPRTIAVVFALILATAIAWKVVLQPSVRRTVADAPAIKAANANIQTLANQTGVQLPSPGTSVTPSPGAGNATTAGGTPLGNPAVIPVSITAGAGNTRSVRVAFPADSKSALSVSAIVVQNAFNDAGVIAVRRHPAKAAGDPEDDVLLRQSLFGQASPSVVLSPALALAPGDTILVSLLCVQPGTIATGNPDNPGPSKDQCDVSLLISGFARGDGKSPPATPSPTPLSPP